MLISLFTDASVLHCQSVGAWAAWAKLDGVTMRASGVFKDSPRDSTHAEMMAITNGLHSVIGFFGCGPEHTVLVQTDSLSAIDGLTSGVPHVRGKPTSPGKRARRAVYTRFSRMVLGARIVVRFKHVKGHSSVDSGPRFAVNNWCDHEAKSLMRAARDEHLQPVSQITTISEVIEARTW
jgi:ribonuclease HI